jgi:putative heme-binding domain-containing protein
MYGQDLNPHVYGLMQSCADHIHWAGGDWTKSRGGIGAHDAAGGGHAHAGALIYQGDNWPDAYRGHLFTCNIHGNRINQDYFERKGSGYVARHANDFLLAHDENFRGLVLTPSADGGVFVADWHDTGECHNYDQRQPWGRIFKVTYSAPPAFTGDLAKLSDDELVRLQLHRNEWHVRHARRLLQERARAGRLTDSVKPALRKMFNDEKDIPRKVQALWALHAVGDLNAPKLRDLLDSPIDDVRGWAVRLLAECEDNSLVVAEKLPDMAKHEKLPAVRLALASALQRLPGKTSWRVAEVLVESEEDASDANLPLMVWYGLEPQVPGAPRRAVSLLPKVRLPIVRQYIARRLAEMDGPNFDRFKIDQLVTVLDAGDAAVQRDVVAGLYEALRGQTDLLLPPRWQEVRGRLARHESAEVRERAMVLSVQFGDREAIAALRTTLGDAKADATARRTALQTLVEAKAADLALLRGLLDDRGLRGPIMRALAGFSDPAVPAMILGHYGSLSDAEKADAVATLASRPTFAMALLDAMAQGKVDRRDLSAFTARQLLALNDKALTGKLTRVWGSVRKPQDKSAALDRYLSVVPPDALKKADRTHGRQVFVKTCATCHTLFGEGGHIGPDLTGSQRSNPEYVLTKVLDPSAVVAQDYQVTVITTKGGRTLTGLVKEEDAKTVALQTQNEVIRVAKDNIDERKKSQISMMPEGLLAPLSDVEVRDLIAYLAGAGPK